MAAARERHGGGCDGGSPLVTSRARPRPTASAPLDERPPSRTNVDDKKQKSLTCGGDIFAGPMKAGEKAFLNFSCIPKDVVPEDAAAIEGELEIVGFTGKESKKADTYWKNEDLVPKDRPKGGIKKK